MNAWTDRARYAGIAAGSFGLVVGASFATSAVSGLVHERNMLRNEVQALEQHPHEPSLAPTPSAQPTAPAAGPAPSASPTSTPSPKVLQVAARASQAGGGAPAGPSSPGPSGPSPTPRPSSRCPTASVATVRLPVGVVPCDAVSAGGR